MATSIHFQDEISKELECVICLERVCNPKELLCHHVYCKVCLDDLLEFSVDGSAVITCPKKCVKGPTHIPVDETTNDLGVPYMMKGVLEKMNAMDKQLNIPTDIPCCDWGNRCKNDISIYCITCNLSMCQSCSSAHNKNENEHNFIPVMFDRREQELKVICEKHSTYANYTCCNYQFICLYCLNRQHKGHQHDTVSSQATIIKRALQSEIERMKDFSKRKHDTVSSISSAKKLLHQSLSDRKLLCLRDYIDLLNKEEERIKTKFNDLSTSHSDTYDSIDPTEYYKESLLKNGIKIVLQMKSIKERILKFEPSRNNIPTLNVSLSGHNFCTTNPLGILDVREEVVADEDDDSSTFKSGIRQCDVADIPPNILQSYQDFFQKENDGNTKVFNTLQCGQVQYSPIQQYISIQNPIVGSHQSVISRHHRYSPQKHAGTITLTDPNTGKDLTSEILLSKEDKKARTAALFAAQVASRISRSQEIKNPEK